MPMNALFWFSRWRSFVGLLIAGAAGAELQFILIQKYKIGAWCPVCLSIAACVGLAFFCFAFRIFLEMKEEIAQDTGKRVTKGDLMTTIWKGIAGVSLCALGFFVALIGVAKMDPLAAAEETLKESLVFGKKDSPIEVYLFTDWACPSCRSVEAKLDTLLPILLENVRLTFVDHAIHSQTLNFSPYNVSFMIHNKAEYFKLRHALTELSRKTGTPKEEQVERLANVVGTRHEPLNFADVDLSQKYFKALAREFGVRGTPTMIFVNRETKKGKKLVGSGQISEENVAKAIATLRQ